MEDFVELAELIASFESATTVDGAYGVLQHYAKRLGYTRMSVFDVSSRTLRFNDALVYSDLNQSRIRNWEPVGSFWQHDLVEKSRMSGEPFSLTSVDFGTVSELHCAVGPGINANGVGGGWVVPVREVMKTQAIVVFGDAKPKPNSLAGDLLKLAVQMAWKRSQSLGDAEPEESPSNLTLREVECLRWASKGKTHEEVGRVLSISARTVRFHIQNAKAKMKVETRIQAVARLLKDQPVRASAVRLAAGDR